MLTPLGRDGGCLVSSIVSRAWVDGVLYVNREQAAWISVW